MHVSESKAKRTKEEKDPLVDWGRYMGYFYTIMDREEQKKIADRKMKPMSRADLKKRNIESVRLDDHGQVVVKRFTKTKPINTKIV